MLSYNFTSSQYLLECRDAAEQKLRPISYVVDQDLKGSSSSQ